MIEGDGESIRERDGVNIGLSGLYFDFQEIGASLPVGFVARQLVELDGRRPVDGNALVAAKVIVTNSDPE